MTITLTGPAYAVGRLVPVEELAGQLAGRLRDYGFGTCSVADRPPSGLAAEAITELLTCRGIGPAEIGAVVYGTCSHRSEPDGQERAVRETVGSLHRSRRKPAR